MEPHVVIRGTMGLWAYILIYITYFLLGVSQFSKSTNWFDFWF